MGKNNKKNKKKKGQQLDESQSPQQPNETEQQQPALGTSMFGKLFKAVGGDKVKSFVSNIMFDQTKPVEKSQQQQLEMEYDNDPGWANVMSNAGKEPEKMPKMTVSDPKEPKMIAGG